MKQFLKHLPSCNIMQDWSEAEDAFASTPNNLRGPDFDEAVNEMNIKRNTCTCGVSNVEMAFGRMHDIIRDVDIYGDISMPKKSVQDCSMIATRGLNQLYSDFPELFSLKKRKVVYTEHCAGTFEDGLQVCTKCGTVLCDYTGNWASSDGKAPGGFPEGPLWVTGTNPIQFIDVKPEKKYGNFDPCERTIVQCNE